MNFSPIANTRELELSPVLLVMDSPLLEIAAILPLQRRRIPAMKKGNNSLHILQ